jgi:hypothetical protein
MNKRTLYTSQAILWLILSLIAMAMNRPLLFISNLVVAVLIIRLMVCEEGKEE